MTAQGGYARPGLVRDRTSHDSGRVGFVELFFDLVFVFAVTQVSHGLLHHLTPSGMLETGILVLAIWWAWIYTTWVTNWLNPQSAPVRLLLFAIMLGGLVMSAAIPSAFGEKGIVFAGAYVAIQVGRSVFMALAVRKSDPGNYRNFLRIIVWLMGAGVFWAAGALAGHESRWIWWCAALAIEYVSPSLGFHVPGLGRTKAHEWQIDPHHLSERCGLFIIIALGESLLVTGATFADLDWSAAVLAAMAVAFSGSVAMWWIYFSMAADEASRTFARSQNPGAIARAAYTYCHIPIVAGIILTAVGDELVLAHPGHHAEPMAVVGIVGGPAIFLLGNLLFKRTLFREFLLSHLAGLALLCAAATISALVSQLVLAALVVLILFVVGVWENVHARAWLARQKHPGSEAGHG